MVALLSTRCTETVANLLRNSITSSIPKTGDPLFLVFETDVKQMGKNSNNFLVQQISNKHVQTDSGISGAIVGLGEAWNGWGSKSKHVASSLETVHPERIVAVLDSRDVLLNKVSKSSMEKFVQDFEELTQHSKDAIVVGAESQCCVAAMTHAKPGDFLDEDLQRTGVKACNSGDISCVHLGTKHQEPWEKAMQNLALSQGAVTTNIYANSGIIVGKAKNILSVYKILDMQETEDDQALFTELMLRRPDLIVMDYGQKLIGSTAWKSGKDGCTFDWDHKNEVFTTRADKTSPALLHFQGKFYECYGDIAKRFGFNGNMKRKLAEAPTNSNYNYQSSTSHALPSVIVMLLAVAILH